MAWRSCRCGECLRLDSPGFHSGQHGRLVKWLRHGAFNPGTRVRLPYRLLCVVAQPLSARTKGKLSGLVARITWMDISSAGRALPRAKVQILLRPLEPSSSDVFSYYENADGRVSAFSSCIIGLMVEPQPSKLVA